MDTSLTPEQRTELLLAELTFDEKIALVHGNRDDLGYAGYVPAIPRLGIPAQASLNSRSGVGNHLTDITTFPAAVAQSASWDTNLVRDFGKAVGAEVRGKGANVALGPTMNILRIPHWGRSFETYGEDPYLSGRMAVASIKGTQSEHVLANANMYAINNQESGPDGRNGRRRVSANVDERTMQEIYLPAYEASVKEGKVGSIMCSYNKVNGTYACENEYLLNTVLRDQWNYRGFVMSDWGATHSTVPAATAGLDQEMPGDRYFGQPLKDAVQSGEVSQQLIDDKVRHVLTPMFEIGLFDHPTTGTPSTPVTTPAHGQLARTIAENGTVLLKNSGGALPLDAGKLESVALLGPGATGPMVGGRGSGDTIAPYIVTPVDAFGERLGDAADVNHVECVFGRVCEAENARFERGPALNSRWPGYTGYNFVDGMNWPGAKITWSVEDIPDSGEVTVTVRSANGAGPQTGRTLSLYLDGTKTGQVTLPRTGTWSDWGTVQQTVDVPAGTETVSLACDPGDNCGTNLDNIALTLPGQAPLDGDLLNRQVQLAQQSDVAVVFVQDFQTESLDRPSLSLPDGQDELIEAVAAVNPNTIVVLNTGGPVLMPWKDRVSGIVEAWYGGQEFGNAIANVLLGDVNPAGKLPMTFPASEDQVPANTEAQYPGTPDNQVAYSEGLNVGYRWYDATGQAPLFPFGHGLSYTAFRYSNLSVSPSAAEVGRPDPGQTVLVSFDVTNTGDRPGADVAQVYVEQPDSVGEPPRQLKGFEKVSLAAGETKRVTVVLDWRAFAHWDIATDSWTVADGRYQVLVGNSSRNLPLQKSLDLASSR